MRFESTLDPREPCSAHHSTSLLFRRIALSRSRMEPAPTDGKIGQTIRASISSTITTVPG